MTTPAELNKILFAQLNEITNANQDNLESVIQKTKAVESISKNIIENNKTVLEAVKLKAQYRGLAGEDQAVLPQSFIE